jgi:hypothetical protein
VFPKENEMHLSKKDRALVMLILAVIGAAMMYGGTGGEGYGHSAGWVVGALVGAWLGHAMTDKDD